jgi:hypothetical protein
MNTIKAIYARNHFKPEERTNFSFEREELNGYLQ